MKTVGYLGVVELSRHGEIRVGVAGAGHWGKNLLRNYHALGALAGVCDSDPGAMEMVRDLYPEVLQFVSPEAMFASSEIDAVVISTPAVTHGDLADQALRAGKHTFVEKPLCLDVEQAVALGDLAKTEGLTLMVGHLMHYHPAFEALQALIKHGELGNLRYIYANRLAFGRIRREENALWSFAPHDVAMILAILGKMPITVTASGGHYLSDTVADTTLAHMDFGNNIQAHVFVSWLHPFKDHRLVVAGDKAMAVFDDTMNGSDKLSLYRHDLHWDGDLPVMNKAEAEAVPYGDAEPLRRECQIYLEAVATGAKFPSDADESARVLSVLTACQKSIATGKSVQIEGEAV